MPTPLARAIAAEILTERDRQDAKWGRASLTGIVDGTGPESLPLFEIGVYYAPTPAADLAEMAKAVTDNPDIPTTWRDILLEEVFEALAEDDRDRLRAELVQVAAVAAKWIEGLDIRAGVLPGRVRAPHRFLPAHLRIVVLLSELQGATHTRLERAWAAKSARAGAKAWPMIAASGLRTRVSELARWGIVDTSGEHGRTVANRPARVWQLATDANRRAAIAAGTAHPIEAISSDTSDTLTALLDEAASDIVTYAALEAVAAAAGLRS